MSGDGDEQGVDWNLEDWEAPKQSWQMSPQTVCVISSVVALLLVVVVVRFRFYNDMTLPRKPPRPVAASITNEQLKLDTVTSSGKYIKMVESDAERMGFVEANMGDAIQARFRHRKLKEVSKIKPGQTIEAAGLSLTLRKGKHGGSHERSLDLHIRNTTNRYLAYRIATRPNRPEKVCARKDPLAHNAMVIAPHQTLKRVECLYKTGWYLHLDAVETLEVPSLSAFYLSMLPPQALDVSPRIARDHKHRWRKNCGARIIGTLQPAVASGRVRWRDAADYYARHRCDKYSFVSGYTAFSRDQEYPLPVVGE